MNSSLPISGMTTSFIHYLGQKPWCLIDAVSHIPHGTVEDALGAVSEDAQTPALALDLTATTPVSFFSSVLLLSYSGAKSYQQRDSKAEREVRTVESM